MTRWDQPGVPHRGWRCVGVEDLGADGPKYEPGTCEMCGKERLRYIHTMEHDEYDPLGVGCVCADKMATDYDAKAEEKKLKSKAGRKSRWLSRRWRTSRNGNPMLNLDGLNLGVYFHHGKWKFWITDPMHGTPEYSPAAYGTEEEAKLDLFERYWQVKQEREG